MAFEKELPKWENQGVEPPESKKATGWEAGEKPPADYFNWQWNRTYEALKELQEKAAEKVDVQQAQQTADKATTAAANAQSDIDDYKNEIRSLGLGIDVDPRLSPDLNQEFNTGWVATNSETLNTPPGFSHGVVRIERRLPDRVVQTFHYIVSASSQVRIFTRIFNNDWTDWVEVLHTGNATADHVGALSIEGGTLLGPLYVNYGHPRIFLNARNSTGSVTNGAIVSRNDERIVWQIGDSNQTGTLNIVNEVATIQLRTHNYVSVASLAPSSDGVLEISGLYSDGTTRTRVRIHALTLGPGSNPTLSITLRVSGNDVERLQITSTDGAVLPGADNTQRLGNASRRWSEVFAGTGTINTSDKNEKEQIEELTDAERRVAKKLKGLIRRYKYKDAVEKKGEGARWHFGVIAQEVEQAFAEEGLNAREYGIFCEDVWWEKEEVVFPDPDDPDNPDASQIEPYTVTRVYDREVEGGMKKTRLGVRYDELFAFILAAL